MAADDAAVVVSFRANLKDYEAALKSAVRATERAAKAAEAAVSDIGKKATVGPALAQNFAKSAGQIQNDARVMQYQLNDIFSGLATGQGIRAVQQQLGQIAQQLGGGGLGQAARTMGTALVGMINPINLAVVAFGLLATVAASYFADSEEAAKATAKELKKQADEIDNLATKYGRLFPELKRLSSNLHDQADAAEKAVAMQKALDAAYDDSSKTLADNSQAVSELMGLFEAMNAPIKMISDFQNAFNDLKKAVDDHNASAETAGPLLQELNDIIENGHGKVAKLAKQIRDDLVKSFDELNRAATSAGEAIKNSLNFSMPGAGGPLDLSPITGGARVDLLNKSLGDAANAIDSFVERVIKAESGGDPNAKNPGSTATGSGQFIKSTWLSVFKRNFASEAAGMSDAAILALRTDIEANRRMIRAYATENARDLKNAGHEVTEATLQLAHFLGAGGANKILSAAPGTKVSDIPGMGDAIRSNQSILGGGATREDVLAYANRRARDSGAAPKAEKTNYDELVVSINEKIEAQQRENDINADSTATVDEKTAALQREKAAQEAARVELELNNAAQAQGIPLTDALKAKNHELAQAYAAAGLAADELATRGAAAAKKLADQTAAAQQLAQQLAGMAQSAIGGFINDLRNGVEAGEAFNNMLNRIIDSLIQMALQSLFSGSGLGGMLFGMKQKGGMVGSGGPQVRRSPLVFAGAPRFATGGVVGLKPGEVPIIAHRGEMVIPNISKAMAGGRAAMSAAASGGGRGGNVTNHVGDVNIDMSKTGLVASSSENGKLLGRQIQTLVAGVLIKESRPGGILRKQPGAV